MKFTKFFIPPPQDANGTLTDIAVCLWISVRVTWQVGPSNCLCGVLLFFFFFFLMCFFFYADSSLFYMGLRHSLLNLFLSVFAFVAVENDLAGSIISGTIQDVHLLKSYPNCTLV